MLTKSRENKFNIWRGFEWCTFFMKSFAEFRCLIKDGHYRGSITDITTEHLIIVLREIDRVGKSTIFIPKFLDSS